MTAPKIPKTYAGYIAATQRAQRNYVLTEQARMRSAWKLYYKYVDAMSAIGLHPLERAELTARDDQLRAMLARVADTHGDTPCNRIMWAQRQEGAAP